MDIQNNIHTVVDEIHSKRDNPGREILSSRLQVEVSCVISCGIVHQFSVFLYSDDISFRFVGQVPLYSSNLHYVKEFLQNFIYHNIYAQPLGYIMSVVREADSRNLAIVIFW